MRPLKQPTQPRTADLSRFAGKEIEQSYPRRVSDTAVFMYNCHEYYVPKEYAGQLVYVAIDADGVCNVLDASGEDIDFAPFSPHFETQSDPNS